MVFTATYTSVASVQAKAHNMSTNVTSGDITIFIEDAEALIDAIMQFSFVNSFDATKHGLIQAAATAIAALSAIAADPSTFTDLPEAQSTMDVLWAESWRFLNLLGDERIKTWLKSR